MAQNDMTKGGLDAPRQTSGSAGFGTTTTGTTGTTGADRGADRGIVHSDTIRPTGDTNILPRGSAEAAGFQEGRSGYSPSYSDTQVTERRSSRPSSAVVLGSVVAGAIAGGAIPFMLSGRKSRQDKAVVVHEESRSSGAIRTDRDSTDDRFPTHSPR